MNILYVSTLVSSKYFDKLLCDGYNLELSIQKFNTLLVKGFVENACHVNALSDIPVNNFKKKFNKSFTETEEQIQYKYCTKISINI